jgi:carbamoyltransferase
MEALQTVYGIFLSSRRGCDESVGAMMKDVAILGVNLSHDSSTCLVVNGTPILAIAEERLNGTRHAANESADQEIGVSLPKRAVEYCLDFAGITINELDTIALSTGFVFNRRFENELFQLTADIQAGRGDQTGMHFRELEEKSKGLHLARELTVSDIVKQLPELDNGGKIKIVNHHLAHAASVYHASPFEESAILVVDGCGNIVEWMGRNPIFEVTTMYRGLGNDISEIEKIKSQAVNLNSLGEFYSLVTKFIGFGMWGAGKTMGLAGYGRETYLEEFNKAVRYLGHGRYKVSGSYTMQGYLPIQLAHRFLKIYGTPRQGSQEIRQIDKDLACCAQRVLEETLIEMCRYLRHRSGSRNLCLAGGVALNSVANRRIVDEAGFDNIFIQPAASDDGTALGAGLFAWHEHHGGDKRYVMTDCYLGRSYSDSEIERAFRDEGGGMRYWRSKEIERETAALLADGKIVGWFLGGSEFGPRALGHRSILCDPRDPEMKSRLNMRVKHRESFRPYAPTVILDKCNDYFDIRVPSPFMLLVGEVKNPEVIPAVSHVDGTARIQTVTRATNGGFYSLLEEFYRCTGVPVLLNTSFNEAGKPIVETPEDAVRVFLNTGLDYLVGGQYILRKDEGGS